MERNIHTAGTGPSLSESGRVKRHSGRVKRHSKVAKGNGPDGHGGKLRKTCPLKCGISMLNQDYLVGSRKPTVKNLKTFIFFPLNILQIMSWAESIILIVHRLRCQENKPFSQDNQANKVTESDSGNWTKSNRIPSIRAQQCSKVHSLHSSNSYM